MIILSDHNVQMLETPGAYAIFVVSILNKDNEVIYASTTHFSDIIIPCAALFSTPVKDLGGYVISNMTYIADGSLMALQAPKLSTSVDREQYSLNIVDPDLLIIAAKYNGLIGCKLKVACLFASNSNINITKENLLIVYAGRITGTTHTRKTQHQGESFLTIIGGSPMYNLDQKNGIYFSDPKVKERDPQDTCAERVYISSRNYALHWGR